MLTFAYPILLILLVLVPLCWLLYRWARRSRLKRLKEFGNPEVLKPLMPDVSAYKPAIRITLLLVALTILILTLCRPWGGLTEQSANREGIEVVAAIDVSNSMYASATDDPDGNSRMSQAKLMLERMVDALTNDRMGLVVYAGSAYQLIPVSSDYASVKSFLGTIDPSMIQDQGTNIASALENAINSFSNDDNIGKAIVLITDAEELENEEGVMQMVQEARKRNIQVDVVGVGTPKGSIINTPEGVMTDDNGDVVNSRLNEELGKRIAKEGRGIYVNASAPNALPTLQKQLKDVKRSSLASSHLVQHDELYIYFAALALILLVIEAFMVNRKNDLLRKVTFFRKEENK